MDKCKSKSFKESNVAEDTILEIISRVRASYQNDFPSTEGSHEMSMGDDRL